MSDKISSVAELPVPCLLRLSELPQSVKMVIGYNTEKNEVCVCEGSGNPPKWFALDDLREKKVQYSGTHWGKLKYVNWSDL